MHVHKQCPHAHLASVEIRGGVGGSERFGLENRWEVGLLASGRWSLNSGGRWEVVHTNRWEMECWKP